MKGARNAFRRLRKWIVENPTVRTSRPSFKPIWHQDRKRLERCSVCGHCGDLPLLLDIRSIISPHPQITFAICPECRTILQLDFQQPQYENNQEFPAPFNVGLKFYIEQGAGLEMLVTPAFIARNHNVSRYLEIGCGFGFGLDFASRTFGWQARGIDPSWMAREGRKLLGANIESRYLMATEGALDTYDAIAAVEVLEHIDKPYEFFNIIRANLNPAGIVIITTPNAESIEFGVENPELLAVLTPGYHVVLYTRKSLELALRKAGFTEVQIVVRGATLLAVAGPRSTAIRIDEVFKPAIYRRYLEERLATLDPKSTLGVGLSYRLFKHLVNTGMFLEAEPLQKRLARTLRDRDGLDILDPHRLVAELARPWKFETFVQQLPACLVGLLYFSAMLRLNGHEDRSGAVTYFYAAHVMAGEFRRAQQAFGIADAETADLELQARRHLKLVLDWMTT